MLCSFMLFTIQYVPSWSVNPAPHLEKTSALPRQLKQCCLGSLATPSLSNYRGYIAMLWSQVLWANTKQSLRYDMWMTHSHRCIKTTSIYFVNVWHKTSTICEVIPQIQNCTHSDIFLGYVEVIPRNVVCVCMYWMM